MKLLCSNCPSEESDTFQRVTHLKNDMGNQPENSKKTGLSSGEKKKINKGKATADPRGCL